MNPQSACRLGIVRFVVTRVPTAFAIAATGLLGSVALSGTAAQAASITNQDTTTYQIEIMAKSVRRQHALEPGKVLSGVCDDGCVIRLNGSPDNDYTLEGRERVSIEGGLVYYDGEEVPEKVE